MAYYDIFWNSKHVGSIPKGYIHPSKFILHQSVPLMAGLDNLLVSRWQNDSIQYVVTYIWRAGGGGTIWWRREWGRDAVKKMLPHIKMASQQITGRTGAQTLSHASKIYTFNSILSIFNLSIDHSRAIYLTNISAPYAWLLFW